MLEIFKQETIDKLKKGSFCVVSTGAGISAESGIPTFREAQTGLWSKYDPHELATPEGSAANPKMVWEWYQYRRDLVNKSKPNPGHYAIVELATLFPKFQLITQNIDGFHKLAGSDNILELHGNIHRYKCSRKGNIIESWPETDDVPPHCPDCGSYIRPDVVWFNEMLDPGIISAAQTAARSCDVFISVGTSGVVYPANMLPSMAKHNHAAVIEVNMEKTPISQVADQTLLGKSGDILPRFVDELKKLRS